MPDDALNIRPIDEADLEAVHAIRTDPRVVRGLPLLPSQEIGETRLWLADVQPTRHRLVAELAGQVVGVAALTLARHPRRAHAGEIDLMVHADYWGRGVGGALLRALLRLADDWFNLQRLQLPVPVANDAAVDLLQRQGFEIEGTRRQELFGGDGRYHHRHQMARLRGLPPVQIPAPDSPAGSRQRPSPTAARIRALRPDDAADLHAIYLDPAVGRTTMQFPSRELAQIRAKYETNAPALTRLVAEVDGRAVAGCSLFRPAHPRLAHGAGLGMAVKPALWGRGLGHQLMAALLDLADNWLNLRRVELEVNIDNPAGIHLYQKFGFEIEGTWRYHAYGDGRWAHSYFMARLPHGPQPPA